MSVVTVCRACRQRPATGSVERPAGELGFMFVPGAGPWCAQCGVAHAEKTNLEDARWRDKERAATTMGVTNA